MLKTFLNCLEDFQLIRFYKYTGTLLIDSLTVERFLAFAEIDNELHAVLNHGSLFKITLGGDNVLNIYLV